MKRGKSKLGVGLAVTAGALALTAVGVGGYLYNQKSNYVPTTVHAYSLPDGTNVSGTEADVEAAIAAWWETERAKSITFGNRELGNKVVTMTYDELGASVDFDAVRSQVEYRDWWKDFRGEYEATAGNVEPLAPSVTFSPTGVEKLANFVEKNEPKPKQARVTYSGGNINRSYESAGVDLDPSRITEVVQKAHETGEQAELPLKTGQKKVPDAALDKITTVMGRFSTKYNSGQVARSANIRLAAETINGMILMPGETWSFNKYLGERTTAKGYREAGVYVSGRHDIDVGGGICQVSTTLYNSALKSDLKIASRSPHSLPVPYVPLGQDAAVSYPNLDFKFTNNYDFPIAVAAINGKGSLEFVILGSKEPEYDVTFETKHLSSWSHGEKVVHDGSLPYGVRKVVDKGGAGRKVRTWKVLKKDGQVVKRIDLGESSYRGGPVIVAVNKNAKPPVETVPEPDDVIDGLP